jgi:molybdate transport repressor ModE-like protein
MIDVQRLRVLREVAEHGSFSKAAAALLLTPSAVSQQIAALERTLGTPVVQRGARGTVLTEPGRLLVETADVIISELQSTQEHIGRLTNGAPARLTVATFASGGQRLLPAALTRFVREHPGVEFDIFEHDPEDSIPMVQRGQADLALAFHFDGPPPVVPDNRSGLEWTPLLDDPMWIVLPREHPLAGRASLSLSELGKQRWVQGCVKINRILDGYAQLAGIDIQTCCNTSDYAFAQALISTGIGVGLVPEIALSVNDNLVALPLEAPRPSRFIGAVTGRRGRGHPLVRDLLSALVNR